MFLVFMGPPGAGKATQSKLLLDYLRVPHVSTGDMLRQACAEGTETGRQAQAFMEAGQLVPDELIIRAVELRLEHADCAAGCLFDGFPRTLVQAQALDDLLTDRGTPLDVAIRMHVDEEELIRRLAGRGRSDDRPEIVRHRLHMFEQSIQTLVDYYHERGLLKTVEGLGAPAEVFARIRAALPDGKTDR